jgi:putative spermidine/putrescine transport system substrate-binding protein
MGLAATGLLAPLLARPGFAAGSTIVATFPNNWEDAYRRIVVPMLANQGTSLVIAPARTEEQISKVLAAKQGSVPPPYDALLLSPGDIAVAVKNDLIVPIDPSKLKNWNKLLPESQNKWGPTATVEFCGIGYNPDMVPKPTGYKDLFENPAYAGKVSWVGFHDNTAIQAYSQIAKIYGTGPFDMEAVFKLFKEKKDFLGPIVDGTSQQMTMLQQGEIGAFMASTSNVAKLQSLGVKCEFATPDTGCPAVPVIIVMTKGAANPDAVYEYMDAAISAEAQTALEQPPTEYVPTNTDVKLSPHLAEFITPEQLAKFVYLDWSVVAEHRAEWTKEFDRIIRS